MDEDGWQTVLKGKSKGKAKAKVVAKRPRPVTPSDAYELPPNTTTEPNERVESTQQLAFSTSRGLIAVGQPAKQRQLKKKKVVPAARGIRAEGDPPAPYITPARFSRGMEAEPESVKEVTTVAVATVADGMSTPAPHKALSQLSSSTSSSGTSGTSSSGSSADNSEAPRRSTRAASVAVQSKLPVSKRN